MEKKKNVIKVNKLNKQINKLQIYNNIFHNWINLTNSFG